MSRGVLLLSLLGLTLPAVAAPAKERLVLVPLAVSDTALQKLGDAISEQVLTELGREPAFEVMGPSDLATALGFERQKALSGCTEESSACLIEMSSAMGASWLVTGSLAKLGTSMRVDLKLVQAADGKARFRDGRVIENEAKVFGAVSELVKELRDALPRPAEPASTGSARVGPWVAVGLGAVAAVGGGLALGQALSTRATLGSATERAKLTFSEAQKASTDSQNLATGGTVLLGAGAAAIAGGLAWWALGGPKDVAAAVAPVPGGAVFAVEGSF